MTHIPSWREAYDADPAVIYVLDENLKIVQCNPAWDRFAVENGAPGLTGSRVCGTGIMDVVPPVLHDFYGTAYATVRRFQRQWWHVFDCSSADVSRSFQMRILPEGPRDLVVINTLLREEPHVAQAAARIEEYSDADGVVTMCANCRRVEHLTQPGRWDWLPWLLAASGALVKPGLCSFCFAYHYPGKSRS